MKPKAFNAISRRGGPECPPAQQNGLHHIRIWSLIFVFTLLPLAGCSQAISQNPTTQFTSVPVILLAPAKLAYTASPSPTTTLTTQPQMTSTATATSTFEPTPKSTPKPYLIKFQEGSGDGVDEIYSCKLITSPVPKFILYENGQVIMEYLGQLIETTLEKAEIEDLLSRIKKTGYLEVDNSAGGVPGVDGVYNLPKGFQYGEGGWDMEIEVLGKDILVKNSISEYAVASILDTIDIIRKYKPHGEIRPYIPEKAQLFVLDMTGKNDQGYFNETFHYDQHVIGKWPEELTVFRAGYEYIYTDFINKEQINSIIDSHLISGIPEMGIFIQKERKYFVAVCPDLDEWW